MNPTNLTSADGLEVEPLEPMSAPEVVALFLAAVALGFAIGKRMFSGD